MQSREAKLSAQPSLEFQRLLEKAAFLSAALRAVAELQRSASFAGKRSRAKKKATVR